VRADDMEIIGTNAENIRRYGICSFKDMKKEGFRRKVEWIKSHVPEGLTIKTLYSEKGGTQGMIEYVPGEYCWRPVDAAGYMFIHCIFVGFKREYKGKGYGTQLLNTCIEDAKIRNMLGVAVVTRESAWMAHRDLFIKNGFGVVDSAPPDFELLALKFDKSSPSPKFKPGRDEKLKKLGKGLTIFASDQCPQVIKSMGEIRETAEKEFGITPNIVDMKTYKDAQDCPCPFGAFCIVYDGKIEAHAPISNTRFKNIMNKLLK
jgi:GNAT superfamily N-acetyltransferase